VGSYALGQPAGSGLSFQQVIDGQNPAAGAGYRLSMDGRYRSRLVTCVFTLTTDGNAANRYVTVQHLGADGLPYSVSAASVLVTASTTQRFAGSISRTIAEWNTGTDVLFPLDPVFLDLGGVLRIDVNGAQAGDQLSGIKLCFDQYPTDPSYLPGQSIDA